MIKFVRKDDPEVVELRRRAWEIMRGHGKIAFVLHVGLLRWGGIMFLIFAGVNIMALAISNHLERLPYLLLLNALIWSTAGLLYGLYLWRKNEKNYLRNFGQASQPSDI